MKIAVIDDYQDAVRALKCYEGSGIKGFRVDHAHASHLSTSPADRGEAGT
ncbi:MAG: hypothetical protein HY695_01590 [Deltaproteobacteria bacterium]|nr:hypothetical protein [Deltaproteobacteria bacterium]